MIEALIKIPYANSFTFNWQCARSLLIIVPRNNQFHGFDMSKTQSVYQKLSRISEKINEWYRGNGKLRLADREVKFARTVNSDFRCWSGYMKKDIGLTDVYTPRKR